MLTGWVDSCYPTTLKPGLYGKSGNRSGRHVAGSLLADTWGHGPTLCEHIVVEADEMEFHLARVGSPRRGGLCGYPHVLRHVGPTLKRCLGQYCGLECSGGSWLPLYRWPVRVFLPNPISSPNLTHLPWHIACPRLGFVSVCLSGLLECSYPLMLGK